MILHNYLSNSGRDLIYEYINSLPEAEKIDGYTVLQHICLLYTSDAADEL